jgi:hypothetical protein
MALPSQMWNRFHGLVTRPSGWLRPALLRLGYAPLTSWRQRPTPLIGATCLVDILAAF